MPNPNLALQAAADITDAMRADDPERAAILANVALAFEQQTANLIAYVGLFPNPEGREQLHDLIAERLGLS